MSAPRMILAATDGTDRSRAVLGRAALIARHWGARLALVHIRKPGRRFRLGLARTATRDLMADLTEHGGHPEDLYVLEGAPAEGIAALSAQLQVDLMVLGLHRERRVLDTLRMTTMERITLAVDCPVLVAQAVPAQPYARVLAALSFDPVCTGGLALATRIAPQAQFHAIHALPVPSPDTQAQRDSTRHSAEALRDRFMSGPGLPPNMPQPEIVRGGVHEVLSYRMAEWRPDLLVIARHSGRDRSRLGNYARDLMRAPPTDMLVTTPNPDGQDHPSRASTLAARS
ncbi:universal stress protein [Roseinatronobacter sp.]|uniref:universal stress protein n=1 Tax=Roseinatronobacter sp. TaxID=1945755 RepID=UPI0025D5E26E|nr:universal stress protein [Roseibaca sp.]